MRELCADLQEEAAAAQATAAREQVWEKARTTDQTGGLSLDRVQSATCPHCNAKATGGKFCPECGKPMQAVRTACPRCAAKVDAGVKFCPECGEKLA